MAAYEVEVGVAFRIGLIEMYANRHRCMLVVTLMPCTLRPAARRSRDPNTMNGDLRGAGAQVECGGAAEVLKQQTMITSPFTNDLRSRIRCKLPRE